MRQNNIVLVESAALRFLLSLPQGGSAGNENSRRRPVLCFLHGLGEGPPSDVYTGITAHGPLRPGSSSLAASEFIVAGPQLPVRGDIWRSYADAVSEIVAMVHSRYDGDPARTYLTGFSFGGNGVFDMALQNPSLWAALWPVDPTRVPEADPGLPVWLSSGEASRPRRTRFIERLRLQPPGAGSYERVYYDEGLDHVGTATSAYRNDTIYYWLLSKRA